jgi:hypothetical protein
MKNAQYVQITALSLIILGSLSLVSKNISQNKNTQVAQAAGISTGLVAHWKFDEGSGASVSDSVGTYSGTLVSNPTWSTGKVGSGALNFAGSGQYVKIPTAPAVTAPYSTAFWFYLNNVTSYQGFVAHGLGAANNQIMYDGGGIQILSSSSGTVRAWCNKSFTAADINKWHHVVVSITSSDPSQWKCFVDGADVGLSDSYNVGTYADPGTTDWTIGAYYNNSYWLSGAMDDVRIYSRSLTSADASDLYALGGGVSSGGGSTGVSTSDTTPPVISSVSAGSITSTSATISWTTDETSDTQIEYGPTASYGSSPTANSQLVTNHSVVVTGLTAGTLYHYHVKSKDALGNLATSGDFTFTTTAGTSASYIKSGSTYAVNSCNQKDVQAALDDANIGDTIKVPAGSCTWTPANGVPCVLNSYVSPVCMKKGGKLQGAGVGQTNITFGTGSYTFGGLTISPDSASLSANAVFEVTGFTFNANNQAMNNEGTLSVRSSGTQVLHNLKIHGNTFKNNYSKAITVNGAVNGVVYENTFTDNSYSITAFGGDVQGWTTFTRGYGRWDNLFIEDNTINYTRDDGDVGGTDHGQGAPGIVFRYNTFDGRNSTGGWVFVIHGLQSMAVSAGYTGCGYENVLPMVAGSCDETIPAAEQWSTIKSEYYGNKFINASYLHSMMATRGSWLMMFANDFSGAGSAPRIDYDQYSCDISQKPTTPFFSQHVQNTYVFNNLWNGVNVPMIKGLDFCGDASKNKPYTIRENVDYWNLKTGFNGTAGIGMGPLGNRPATCTIGVGYWATNQSTTNLSGMTGDHAPNPLSGTFYKCTGTNTWTAYYSPYTYPHPLRSGVTKSSLPTGTAEPEPPASCASTNTCKPGDFNKDGTVNTNDYSYLNSSWNTSDPTTDLNKDGRVNTLDYAIMVQNWMK